MLVRDPSDRKTCILTGKQRVTRRAAEERDCRSCMASPEHSLGLPDILGAPSRELQRPYLSRWLLDT